MWIEVSTGLELDLDFRAEDAQAVLGMATVLGTPSKRSRPVGNDRPGQSGAGVGASAVQAGDPHHAAGGSVAAIDMDHARWLAGRLNARRQTRCVAILAYEASGLGFHTSRAKESRSWWNPCSDTRLIA